MAKLEYFLLCESVSVGQETNRVSLFNVLEDLQLAPNALAEGATKQTPYFLGQFVAVALFNREPSDTDREFEARLTFTGMPEDKPVPGLKFKMERHRQRIMMRFAGMPAVPEDGKLEFRLLLDGEHCASHIIMLHRRDSSTL